MHLEMSFAEVICWIKMLKSRTNFGILINSVDQDFLQGSHRLEKYVNIQDCLEKSLKIKFALKSTWKTLKGLEKSLNSTFYKMIQQFFGDLNQ